MRYFIPPTLFRPRQVRGLFLLFLFSGSIFAQSKETKLLDNQTRFAAQHPQEKVYVLCDKPFYLPDETLYFTAFVRDAALAPTATSDAIIVEWLNPRGTVDQRFKLYVEGGMAQGDISLKGSPGGLYKLRAYTWQMQNDPQPAIFEKEIQVQAVVLPRLKMKLKFEREAYKPGEEVEATAEIQTQENEPLARQSVQCALQIEGKNAANFSAETDDEGKATLKFRLPTEINRPDGLLNLKIPYQQQTEAISRSVPIVLDKIELKLFPEGGQLVAAQLNRMAFQAWNEFGKPADVKGYVADAQGKTVCQFSSYYLGMGAFSFKPEVDKRYFLHLTSPVSKKVPVPLAQKQGYLLSVLEQNDHFIRLSAHASKSEPLRLIALQHDKIIWDTLLRAQTAVHLVKIPLEKCVMGMVQLTLFDKGSQPQAERLVFVKQDEQLHLSIQTDKEKYGTREKVNATLTTTDSKGQPVSARLALSVANDALLSYADDKSSTILSFLLLESELKQTVENPAFYFDPKEDKTQRSLALDLLMMTAGWRRYTWEEIKKPKTPDVVYAPDKIGLVSRKGKVLMPETQQGVVYTSHPKYIPAAHCKISIEGLGTFYTDEQGEYHLFNLPDLSLNIVFEQGNFRCETSSLYNNQSIYLYQNRTQKQEASPKTLTDSLVAGTMLFGRVLGRNGIPEPYATVMILKNGEIINGANADENGNYEIGNIEPGVYTVQAEVIGDIAVLPNVSIGAMQQKRLNITLGKRYLSLNKDGQIQAVSPSALHIERGSLPQTTQTFTETASAGAEAEYITQDLPEPAELSEAVEIVAYKLPVFEKDPNMQTKVFSGSEIRNMGSRSIAVVAATTPGVFQSDDRSDDLFIRGSRVGSTVYIIDGQKVRGNPNLPLNAISQMQVVMSGVPAEYGDFTGGAVVIETGNNGMGGWSPSYSYGNGGTTDLGFRFAFKKESLVKKSPYMSVHYKRSRTFPTPDYERNRFSLKKDDFRTTLYWNGNLQTNQAGKAQVSFFTSDEITSFRFVAEGIGTNQQAGRGEHRIYTQNPVSMDVKLPLEVVAGDTVVVPLVFRKLSQDSMRGHLAIVLPQSLKLMDMRAADNSPLPLETLAEGAFKLAFEFASTYENTFYLYLFAEKSSDLNNLSFQWLSPQYREAIDKPLKVTPRGFPQAIGQSGKAQLQSYHLDLSNSIPGTESISLTIYPSILSDILQGMEGLLREPYGCFEQTSSITYPNVLVLDLLRGSGRSNPATEQHALSLIEKGYKRLMGYECKNGGFSWFGDEPANLTLTAYGIMEFKDMRRVWGGVEEKMINRTVDWVLKQRDGKGGFSSVSTSASMVGYNALNAYVLWALSEVKQEGLEKEINSAWERAIDSKDNYAKALMANVMMNYGRKSEGMQLIAQVLKMRGEDGSIELEYGAASPIGSEGKALRVEVAALSLMALLKSPNPNEAAVQQLLAFIYKHKDALGYFCNTQSTILCLKALSLYANHEQERLAAETLSFRLTLNGKPHLSETLSKKAAEPYVVTGLEQYLQNGQLFVGLEFTGDYAPNALAAFHRSRQPESNDSCALRLHLKAGQSQLQVGDNLRWDISLENVKNRRQAMSVIILPLPAGCTAQAWQLKELQHQKAFDYYEIRQNELILYYTELKALETKMLHIDLKAELPGSYQAQPARAYLYYKAEEKDWVESPRVRVAR